MCIYNVCVCVCFFKKKTSKYINKMYMKMVEYIRYCQVGVT